ncbi:MAG: helix-turn-helix domain-containing protein [Gammaproteobacteria bacterium]|nr:helix-turn-helix domain-containing protein [Gammaproteobacteria bacterium]
MTERELHARDRKRDLGAELLASVREMKAGKVGHTHKVSMSAVTAARTRGGFSQQEFASLMGVSKRTLQEWEQGRRHPTGAARTLLSIAAKRPDVLRQIVAEP